MELTVIGVGYVGLVTGACFAEMGYKVTCLDIDQQKIQSLKEGIIPIYEPGLEEIVNRNSQVNRLFFTTDYKNSVATGQVIFLALPTPSLPNGDCDMTALLQAAAEIGKHMQHHKTVVIKSTVPVGTCQLICRTIQDVLDRRSLNISFDVISNPEFLKEGCAVNDFMRPDRVIIGCDTESGQQLMKELYRPFMLSRDRILFMDIASAELTKYAANAMLATRISFMNWLSLLAERSGADITSIRKGIGSDKRIGYDFLWAGIGFGGSCLPKDLKALRGSCVKADVPTDFIDAIIAVNDRQKLLLPQKIIDYYAPRGGLSGITIAVLGLSFKPDTDDMREAASLTLIESLRRQGCKLRLYDPVAMDNAKKILTESQDIEWCSSETEAARSAHAIVLVTEWKQFRLLNFSGLLQNMRSNVFFDGRNQYDPTEIAKLGFDYISIGRQPSCHTLEQSLCPVEQSLIS